ncbi:MULTISPECIES: hypothetical protein [unclassified Streptomyces]|uniref:hypothetical protein n=2 Tax=Streptomyces TaxID=1883 RepID=UPI002ED0382B|nr:hypothetical protein OIC96_00045 [Streptomyces sp. NBC_00775]WTI42403.1 hypothetical protein OIC96_49685 [Streptomyces sp. NBC_00775]
MSEFPVEQTSLRLTPHPLQRVGAFALAAFAGAGHPDMVAGPLFAAATEKVTEAAVQAALVRDTKAEAGFLLKCSYSLWPNSKMNHPRNKKLSDAEVSAAVRAWRTIPAPECWPEAGCVLCGAAAVGFYGKSDVVLAESIAYRNSTPRGHSGVALCWPCVCSFHAIPFGSQLSGGPSTVVHTWDERLAAHATRRQVQRNGLLITAGAKPSSPQPEVAALAALRGYEHRVAAGVELLVFTNNNQDQVLTSHAVDQPLAEWLRTTTRLPARRTGFACLLRACRTDKGSGAQNLAWRVFHRSDSLPGVLASHLVARTEACGLPAPESPAVAELTGSYLHEVMHMEEKDLTEIRGTAQRIAALFKSDDTGGKLTGFHALFRAGRGADLRSWLQRHGVEWVLTRPEDGAPLITERGFELLFSPSQDGNAWFFRQYLLTSVLAELHRRGWQPKDAKSIVEDFDPDAIDPADTDALEEGITL